MRFLFCFYVGDKSANNNNRITYVTCFVYSQETKHCGAPCHALFFKENERTILRYWVGSWAAICCASCLFTVSSRNSFKITPAKCQIAPYCEFLVFAMATDIAVTIVVGTVELQFKRNHGASLSDTSRGPQKVILTVNKRVRTSEGCSVTRNIFRTFDQLTGAYLGRYLGKCSQFGANKHPLEKALVSEWFIDLSAANHSFSSESRVSF